MSLLSLNVGFIALAMTLLSSARDVQSDEPRPLPQPRRDKFVDVRGGTFQLPEPNECKAVVLLFIGHDCPISNGYAPEIVRICQEYAPKRVSFCIVYADADMAIDAARTHAKDFGFRCPAVLDPKMALALKVGATVKPEAAVLSAAGELLYRGRIDDRYVDFGKRRENVTRRELRDALDSILAGRAIAVPRTKAIGCDIDLPAKQP